MKSNYFFSILFLTFSLFIFNCSGDDTEDGGGNQVASISVSSNISIQEVGNPFVFTATTNTELDITSESTFKVNGNAISGNTFIPSTAGSYTIKATYGTLTSSQITIIAIAEVLPITSIILTANATSLTIGENFVFSVNGDNGEDVSSSSMLTVDGDDISGISYAATTVGTYTVQATYNEFTSNELSITVLPAPIVFTKNVLIEDYTGTWCGYCPRVAKGIELVEVQTSRLAVVAIHLGNDPYTSTAGNSLANLFGVSGLPTARLDRTIEWNYPEPNNITQATNLTGDNANLGLALSPVISGNDISVDVSVKFGDLFNGSDVKLVVYLLEDGLIYNQTNYTSYYGGASVLTGFEHNDVLRASFTEVLGDSVPSNEAVADNTYSTTLNMSMPSNVANPSNVKVIAFITNSSNTSLNTRVANFGDTQNFEEN